MSIRTERVAKLLQREFADILQSDFSNEIPGLVTVTGARVTKDLSIAYMYVSVLAASTKEQDAVFDHVKSLLPKIRWALGGRIRHQVRKIPELRLFLDDTQEITARMDHLFDEIRADDDDKPS